MMTGAGRKVFSMRISMKMTWLMVGALSLAAGCAHKGEDEENEVKMRLDEVPPAARSALEREAGGAAITTVDREQAKGGGNVYETDVMMNGKNWEIKVDETGKLVSKKLDPEEHKH